MTDEVIAELRREMDVLRARVFELEGAQRAAAPVAPVPRIDPARVSRRNLLGKAGAVAAAGAAGSLVGGGVLAQPAAAAGTPLNLGTSNQMNSPTSVALVGAGNQFGLGFNDLGKQVAKPGVVSVWSSDRGAGKNVPAFRGDAEASYAFYGTSTNVPAVFGTSTGSAGVQGNCTESGPAGVIGASTWTDGVFGLAVNNGRGVYGKSTGGPGVSGESQTGAAVQGISTGGNGRGVYAESDHFLSVHGKTVNGTGVFGDAVSGVGVSAFATSGLGLAAESRTGGTALRATAGAGIGATFQGSTASIRLVPQTTAGKPTTGLHTRGEMLCDKNGVLWFCTAGGGPGTWRKVTLG